MSHLVMVLSKQQWPRLSLKSLEFHLYLALVYMSGTGTAAGTGGLVAGIAGVCAGCRTRDTATRPVSGWPIFEGAS